MRILIIGYGKMGKAIDELAQEQGFTVAGVLSNRESSNDIMAYKGIADVAVEFTQPNSGAENITACAEAEIPVVSGTTGWLDRWEEVTTHVRLNHGAFFYASNFSIGMNLVFQLARELGPMASQFHQFDIGIRETHHPQKKDEPSGTAITLAEKFIEKSPKFSGWELNGKTSGKLPIMAFRKDNVVGEHNLEFISGLEEFGIYHKAKDRKVFANGAIQAAIWLKDKKGVFGMEDLLRI